MRLRLRLLAAATLTLTLIACNDMAAPLSEDSPTARNSRNLKSSATVSTVDAIDFPDVPPGTLAHLPDAPALRTYNTTFRVIQGSYKDLFIRYTRNGRWFMKVHIPEDARFVDTNGVPYANGDTVYIDVEIDRTRFYVRFGPRGSDFEGRGAVVTFNLQYADLTGRNIDDAGVMYQPAEGEEWVSEPTTVDARRNQVSIFLRHFSNYRSHGSSAAHGSFQTARHPSRAVLF